MLPYLDVEPSSPIQIVNFEKYITTHISEAGIPELLASVSNSDVRARLGSKAPAWARLLGARAYQEFKPGCELSKP